MGYSVIIPARLASTRLPEKPLREIAGKPMIAHVVEQARQSSAERIIVASESAEVLDVARDAGAEVCLTRGDHESGSDRLAEVVDQLDFSSDTIVVNLQGDEPLMPPSLLERVAIELESDPHAGVSTLATPIRDFESACDPNHVKVVMNEAGRALYFSRAMIPHPRDLPEIKMRGPIPETLRYYRHLGLYAYRAETLRRFHRSRPTPLELIEKLEQLRLMAMGIAIRVSIVAEAPPPGVDTEEDLLRVQSLLSRAS